MGFFDIGIVTPEKRLLHRQRCPNHLMYEAHDRVLRKILPSELGTISWELGFSGPMYRDTDERPNYDTDSFSFSRRNKLSDFKGGWGNEGGAAEDDIRDLFGYSRASLAAIDWEVENDGEGVIISTDWQSFANQLTWEKHGTWEPVDWNEDDAGPYPEPYKYTDCERWESDHGYPWCTPRVHDDWWTDNEFGVNCGSCSGHNMWSIAGYPVGAVFVVIKKSGQDDVLFAAALFAAPLHWRPGSTLYARYSGRFN